MVWFRQGNVNPTVGGVVWGNYLVSHNVKPSVLPNTPERPQTYAHPKNDVAVARQNAAERWDPTQDQAVARAARRHARIVARRKLRVRHKHHTIAKIKTVDI
jgi:hypothetical protein